MVQCTNPIVDVSGLEAYHEEANIRVVVHSIQCNSDCIVVAARDTDVLILLLAHITLDETGNSKETTIHTSPSHPPKYDRWHGETLHVLVETSTCPQAGTP